MGAVAGTGNGDAPGIGLARPEPAVRDGFAVRVKGLNKHPKALVAGARKLNRNTVTEAGRVVEPAGAGARHAEDRVRAYP